MSVEGLCNAETGALAVG